VENVIEVRYAGVVVGRSTRVRDWDTAGAFIGFAEPLPTGTSLVLRGDGVDQPARVVEVFESADPAVVGMQVKFSGAAEAARPAPKPGATEAKPAPERARAPEAAVVTAPASAAEQAPAAVAEAAPVEASDAAAAVAGEVAGSATSEQGEGDAGPAEQSGQPGQAGKRRRRRR
jgi:hypothetical protein